jgi:hypothetical protein
MRNVNSYFYKIVRLSARGWDARFFAAFSGKARAQSPAPRKNY